MKSNQLTILIIAAVIAAIWELVWKGMALWQAAQARHKGWFVALLILNSAGILPIIYLLVYKNTSRATKK
jgi:hypothetical protein